MSFSVIVWCLSHNAVERSIERLAVGKSNNITNLLDCHIRIPFVGHAVHSLLYSVFVYKAREVCVESRIYNSRDISGVGVQFFCQILCREILVTISLFNDNDI